MQHPPCSSYGQFSYITDSVNIQRINITNIPNFFPFDLPSPSLTTIVISVVILVVLVIVIVLVLSITVTKRAVMLEDIATPHHM